MTVALIVFILASSDLALTANDVVVDMPGLFKMQRIESLEEKGFRYQIRRYWRTDDELLLSASQYKDWKAAGAWDQRVFRWNIETGAISETPYVGSLNCATKGRLVLRRDVEVPDDSDPAKEKNRNKRIRMVLSGAVFGEPAEPIASNAYNPYSCEPMERKIAGDFGPDMSLLPLLPDHGRLLTKIKPLERAMWFLPKGSDERIQIGAGTTGGFGEETSFYPYGQGHPAYLPWRGQYFLLGRRGDHRTRKNQTYDASLYFLAPDGHLDTQREPAWIAQAEKTNRLVVSFVATRAGVVWNVKGPIRGELTPFDGLYLERNSRLVRFLKYADLSQGSVSPGGCRALITIDPTHRNFPNDGPTELHLIDFCQEDSI
jgi:hypothetical protein